MIFVIREHQLPCVVLQKHLCGDPEYHKRDMPEEGYPSCERVTQTKAPGDTYAVRSLHLIGLFYMYLSSTHLSL